MPSPWAADVCAPPSAVSRRRFISGIAAGVVAAPFGWSVGHAVAAGHPAATDRETSEPPDLILRYDEPATSWESHGLPIGNGHLGAVIFGGIGTERIQFNEKTLWSGGPSDDYDYTYGNWTSERPDALGEARRLVEDDVEVAPERIASLLGQSKVGYGSYSTFGELRLDFGDPEGPVDYARELDIRNSVASVRYTDSGVGYTREYLASHPDGVLVVRLTADQPASLTFDLSQTIPPGRSNTTVRREEVGERDARLTVAGNLDDNQLRFESQLRVVAEGGTVGGTDTTVRVAGADAVTILLAAGTDYAPAYPDYRGEDPHDRVTGTVDDAARTPYPELRDAHVADYRELFDRFRLDLGQQAPELTTDELLAAYGAGELDPAGARYLEVLYAQYGRYLLISSSRPGTLPANLQGVWAQGVSNPWSADYHVNINLQMNYWPAELTNLAETAEPLHDFIDALRAPGAASAEEMFDARGWVVQNETNPFGYTGVHDWPTAFWFPEANGWLCRHLWEHYLFTRDEEFLRERAYPIMKGAAEFWLDFLVEDRRDGSLVVSPSYSPEHGPYTAGAAMSQQIVWDLLTSTIEAAETLDADHAFRAELHKALDALDPGLRIGSWGQLQEWKTDIDDPDNDHRHVSHLYALHPGNQISPATTPDYTAAAEVSLNARGDGGTGWSKAWKVNFWARLLDGDRAHKMLREQLVHSTLPNLWDTHPPFQIDGNFGGTAGVAEMLVQSHTDAIEILPAVPDSWPDGAFDGLRARGAATVGATWSAGALVEARITADRDGALSVRHAQFDGPVRVYRANDRPEDFSLDDGVVTVDALAGETYRIVPLARLTMDVPAELQRSGADVPITVTLAANERTLGVTQVTLEVPDGWSTQPESIRLAPVRPRVSRTAEFTVRIPPDAADGTYRLAATVATDEWSLSTDGRLQVGRLNHALGRSASQSSTAHGGAPQRAVDGDTSGVYGAGSVTHTDFQPESWWQVDLGESQDISEIAIWNRTDCCSDRLTDFYVHVSEEPFASAALEDTLADDAVWSYHHAGQGGTPSIVDVDRSGRYVRVQLASDNALSLAEVQVFGAD
ncbi:glycosyl hydrolase family 95 catalytic domain-containing protein [Phytoactinopolyspora halotolerans]|uniref:Alpha-L-fucosidase n=1 Tax=Phytoactinopolyspora halotolerans TaxID=1981512 RepID=A0A6L9S7E9_9ACTN|nr:glycoside hydrolase N-terminal domain-containing protein [Phytoactinopolyspora halotolerans]NEE00893.1 alpha-L-fucosidase [Phytoactinopolyspora halotolerans]